MGFRIGIYVVFVKLFDEGYVIECHVNILTGRLILINISNKCVDISNYFKQMGIGLYKSININLQILKSKNIIYEDLIFYI